MFNSITKVQTQFIIDTNNLTYIFLIHKMKTVDEQLSEQYDCLKKLGSGAFGHLILVKSKTNNQQYACKIQKNHGKKMILVEKQFKMLAHLMDTKRFPLVYTFKILQKNSYMIMEKLNNNLDDIFLELQRKFSLKTLAMIINEMMLSMQALHTNSYLHRDIKPENIMTSDKAHTIKLIDFGLAEKLFAKQSSALIGNVRFCSRKAHFGLSGKKQDLQNLLFVIYYFLTDLPWHDASEEDIHKQIQRKVTSEIQQKTYILSKKQNFLSEIKYPPTKNLIKIQFYQELHRLAKQILGYPNDTAIDYCKLLHMTERLMTIIGVNKGDCYDWCPKNCQHVKPYSQYWQVFD